MTASDGTFSAEQTFTWDVSSPVSLTNPGTQTNAEGATVSLTLSASDSSSGTLSYSADRPASRPEDQHQQRGHHRHGGRRGGRGRAVQRHRRRRRRHLQRQQTFTWNVTSPVTLVPIPDQTNTEGDSVSLAISASDPQRHPGVHGRPACRRA